VLKLLQPIECWPPLCIKLLFLHYSILRSQTLKFANNLIWSLLTNVQIGCSDVLCNEVLGVVDAHFFEVLGAQIHGPTSMPCVHLRSGILRMNTPMFPIEAQALRTSQG
jgi:hypothetical protein